MSTKWFPTRQAVNAKEGAGPLMGWPFKDNPALYHIALRSRHLPASTIIGLDVHGQHTPKGGSPVYSGWLFVLKTSQLTSLTQACAE
jgi:hypothetical protein